MKAQTYLFEGEMRTVSEVSALVPAISQTRIREHLRAGRTSRVEMLSYNVSVARSVGGRKGRMLGGWKHGIRNGAAA